MKLAEYYCVDCDTLHEELFMDTEEQPEFLDGVLCGFCGGVLVRGLNIKNNCQVWKFNDRGGI